MLKLSKVTTQAIAGPELSQESTRDGMFAGLLSPRYAAVMRLKSSNNGLSNHILPTSANLLGICFLIFTIARTSSKGDATLLDELAGVAVAIFMLASICSYVSLRLDRENYFELVADVCFFIGLLFLATTAMLMIFKYVV